MDTDTSFMLPPFTCEPVFTPLSQSIDWGLRKLNIPEMWKTTRGEGVTVVVIDTGFPGTEDHTHPDLENNAVVSESKSFVHGETMYDLQAGHSTAACGIIAAEDNEMGYVGYAPEAKVICLKALKNNGGGTAESVEAALLHALAIKPDIVSMSLGSPKGSSRMHDLIRKLDSLNIPVVVAAGNGGAKQGVLYPAKYEECFAIGAYDSDGKIASFSAVGPEVDFAFPGVNITTTFLNDGYATVKGTSFACPACVGLMALIISKHKKDVSAGKEEEYKSTMDLYNILKSMSHNPNTPDKKDVYFGWGIVDVSNLGINELSIDDPPEKTTYHSSFVRFLLSMKRFFQKIF
jgi:subtilisin family serine protease